jgi:hypothetical protein
MEEQIAGLPGWGVTATFIFKPNCWGLLEVFVMKKLLLLVMVGAVLLSVAPVLADGDFYVVAAGGGVGTKITSLPKEITSPGFYYLAGNLSYTGASSGIDVKCDDVTIDLMGFSLTNNGTGGAGIQFNNHKNVEIRNGTFSGWTYAISDGPAGGARNRALNIRVENGSYGIQFIGTDNLIKGCISDTLYIGIVCHGGVVSGNTVSNNDRGIVASKGTISGNTTRNCHTYGIEIKGASTVIHNTVVTTMASQIGFYINTADPTLVIQNTASGPGTRLTPGDGTVNVTNAGF